MKHFERIIKNSGDGTSMKDILFFDNELGNCRQIASLGVTVCYCPEGVTSKAWEMGLASFPSNNGKVVGL